MPDDGPSFEIPAYPRRVFSRDGVEHDGMTAFTLTPTVDCDPPSAVGRVVSADRYVYGDWFDLPVPVYLVYDRVVSTVFRVVCHPDRVELRVLPSTEPAGLEAFYRAVRTETDVDWSVTVETTIDE